MRLCRTEGRWLSNFLTAILHEREDDIKDRAFQDQLTSSRIWAVFVAYAVKEPTGSHRRRSPRAADRYAQLVASVPDASRWDSALRQQIYRGDEAFVERMQALAESRNSADIDIPKI